jgi:hypothetical protein
VRIISTQIKKSVRCKVICTSNGEVRIKFPKQNIGNIALEFDNGEKKIILRQWEVVLTGDTLMCVRIK